jgi:hypothetical protein
MLSPSINGVDNGIDGVRRDIAAQELNRAIVHLDGSKEGRFGVGTVSRGTTGISHISMIK